MRNDLCGIVKEIMRNIPILSRRSLKESALSLKHELLCLVSSKFGLNLSEHSEIVRKPGATDLFREHMGFMIFFTLSDRTTGWLGAETEKEDRFGDLSLIALACEYRKNTVLTEPKGIERTAWLKYSGMDPCSFTDSGISDITCGYQIIARGGNSPFVFGFMFCEACGITVSFVLGLQIYDVVLFSFSERRMRNCLRISGAEVWKCPGITMCYSVYKRG